MSGDLEMKLFVTRWLVLIVLTVVIGEIANYVSYLRKSKSEVYKGTGFWWLLFLALSAFHVLTFTYNRSFSHWAPCIGAGLMIGWCAMCLVGGFGNLRRVKALRAYAVATVLAFPLAIWLGAERLLLFVFDKLRS